MVRGFIYPVSDCSLQVLQSCGVLLALYKHCSQPLEYIAFVEIKDLVNKIMPDIVFCQ